MVSYCSLVKPENSFLTSVYKFIKLKQLESEHLVGANIVYVINNHVTN